MARDLWIFQPLANRLALLAAQAKPQGGIQALRFLSLPARGFSGGRVIHLAEARRTLGALAAKAQADRPARGADVHVIPSSPSLKFYLYGASCSLAQGRERVIRARDLEAVGKEVKKHAILPLDEEVLEVRARSWRVDDVEPVVDPVGLSARRLAQQALLMTAPAGEADTLRRLFESLDLDIASWGIRVAESAGVLREEEKRSGVWLIDVGSCGTQLAYFSRGVMRSALAVPVGVEMVSGHLARSFNVSREDAERLHLQYAVAARSAERAFGERVPIDGRGVQQVPWEDLARASEAAFGDYLSKVRDAMQPLAAAEGADAPVVVTGEDVLREGFAEAAAQALARSVRIGFGKPLGGVQAPPELAKPDHSAMVGLLARLEEATQKEAGHPWMKTRAGRLADKVLSWLDEIF